MVNLRKNWEVSRGFGDFSSCNQQAGKLARSYSVLAKISTWFSRNSSASAELWDFNKVLPEKV